MAERRVSLPLTDESARSLRAGEVVRLNGILYTARDAAHKRLLAQLEEGVEPPMDLAGQVIYYVGPAPAKDGDVIGPAGPTTSARVDPYTAPLLALGVKGLIGKGYRSAEIKEALVRHGAVYMAAIGGAAALIARHVKESRVIAYEDLGTEAVRELLVEDFPVIVVNDTVGGDAYVTGRMQYETDN
jgi:fumarate hydratase subunit beta